MDKRSKVTIHCKLCGQVVLGATCNQKYCTECRKIRNSINSKASYNRRKKAWQEKTRLQYRRCTSCGVLLQNNHQSYCLDCLLKSVKYGTISEKKLNLHRLSNRGYDYELVLETIKERNI